MEGEDGLAGKSERGHFGRRPAGFVSSEPVSVELEAVENGIVVLAAQKIAAGEVSVAAESTVAVFWKC